MARDLKGFVKWKGENSSTLPGAFFVCSFLMLFPPLCIKGNMGKALEGLAEEENRRLKEDLVLGYLSCGS